MDDQNTAPQSQNTYPPQQPSPPVQGPQMQQGIAGTGDAVPMAQPPQQQADGQQFPQQHGQQMQQQPYQQQGQQPYYQQPQQPQPYGDQQQYPVQQPQPQPQISPGGSPEAPSVVGGQERAIVPEQGTEQQRAPEQAQEKAGEQGERALQPQPQEKQIAAPDKAPEQKKFESPFSKVYGYKASPQVETQSKKNKGKQVQGDPTYAKTWLIVLLGRLLRMYRGKDSEKLAK